jgi:hypothetical protein
MQNRTVNGKTLINATRIISGTLPTKLNLHRGRTAENDIKCRRCQRSAETDMHVLNECVCNKNAISQRHNKIALKLGKDLTNAGWDVQLERTHVIDQERFKPDITAKKEDKTLFLDITVPYEKSIEYLQQREREKEIKYEPLRRLNPDETTIIMAIAIGTAGTTRKETCEKLRTLGLTKKTLTALSRP